MTTNDYAAFRRELGSRLRVARERAGCTTGEAASVLGVSVRNVENIEAGTDGVTAVGFAALARAYGTTPEEIVLGRAPAPSGFRRPLVRRVENPMRPDRPSGP